MAVVDVRATTRKTEASLLGRPRLGFAGVGWIGRHRLTALAQSALVDIVAITDPDKTCLAACQAVAPESHIAGTFEELLKQDLDAVVIATPNAFHAEQALAAFDRGLAVFCQKPLGRSAIEVYEVVDAARQADRLLGVDLSYRWTAAASAVRDLLRSGQIGNVFHVELTFHNSYGPDKDWFYDRRLAGGGCVLDLGVHLVDLALWALEFPQIEDVVSRLYDRGQPLGKKSTAVEDFAVAQMNLTGGASVTLQCSWKLHVGCDAVIAARFYGERGSVMFENVNGSFYDFVARRCEGTRATSLVQPPDAWPGRAAVEWARQLQKHPGFDPDAEQHVQVAEILDRIYSR
jgi:predicted dehydrogenase